ncbi:MAG TPA: methionine--tRNA ligase [Chitinivibrionales bacterium]|nr:methionine--tRNA ligase [Chitinivibrionales bacterium]
MTKKNSGAAARTFLVTGALPYANSDLHLGHLVEAVQTDVFVRFQKLLGNRAVYVCADDTHGTAIQINAMKQGVTPEKLVAGMWERHKKDYAGFNIGFDVFYTTNSEENRHYAELIYKSLKEKGLIEEKEISQYFCETDGRFLPDRFIKGTCPNCGAADQYGDVCEVCGSTYDPTDLKSPVCITCGKTPVLKSSRHVFVQLERRHDFLDKYVGSGVLADEVRNFAQSWLSVKLREWCISRDAPYFGFEIPGMPGKYFYVWLDAPIGYMASTKKWCDEHHEKMESFWSKEADCSIVHFIGKDITYFHTLFWPVMLDSAGFRLPSKIFVHGFLNIAGEKMSKSRGTFILARDFLDKAKHPQAAEFLRFFFASKLSGSVNDFDLNAEEFQSRVNTVLANNIGNFHHRTVVFCERYFDAKVPDAAWEASFAEEVVKKGKSIADAYAKTDYKSVIEQVQELGDKGNKYYQDSKPWELLKTDKNAAAKVMVTCLNMIRSIAVFLKPITPDLVKKIEDLFGAELSWNDHVFSLRSGKLGKTEILVQPLEMEQLELLRGQGAVQQAPSSASAAASAPAEIDIAAVKALDLRVATVLAAEKIEKSDKLLKLQLEMGGATRQIVAGVAQSYNPESLVGKQVVVVANLKSAVVRGVTSDGMLLAALDNGKLSVVQPDRPVAPGSKVS